MKNTVDFQTLPSMLQHVSFTYNNAKAFNYLYMGNWESVSTNKFFDQVSRLALGLISIGVKPKQGVGIIAHPSPQWLMMDLAIQIAQGISVPMFPNISSENFDFEVKDANIKYLFIESDELLEEPIKHKLNSFEKVFSFSVHSRGANLIYFEQLKKLGDELSQKEPSLFAELIESIEPDAIATLIYTSGSTGMPKGVELTHKNLVSQIKSTTQTFNLNAKTDHVLSCLPLAHVFERMVIYYYMSTGMSIYFADDIKNVGALLKEVKPTCITLVPRILEKVYTKMNMKPQEEKGFKKYLLSKALARLRNKKPGSYGVFDALYEKLVYSKLREALGGKLRMIFSGGAALDQKVNRFFVNAGFPLYEGYGLTEASPCLAVNSKANYKFGTVGKAFPGVELKIGKGKEILARGENIMKGYHNCPEATKEIIDAEGWLHTGDQGNIDKDGFLRITGRIKEMYKTSTGKYVSPVPIENTLCSSSDIIDQALVVADARPYVTLLVWPDFENIEMIKKKRKATDLSDDEFLNQEFIKTEIQALITRVNKKLNHWEQIQKFALMKDRLSIENGDLTPKMNIRRKQIHKKYKDEIEKLYE